MQPFFYLTLDVSLVLRKVANQITTYEDIKQEENGEWELVNSSTFTTTTLRFKLGEAFDEVTPSGAHMKVTKNLYHTFQTKDISSFCFKI